jgi:transcriptional regulator with XRE-family HTH domain
MTQQEESMTTLKTALSPAERLDLLIRGGEALYGPNWQSALARGLGINVRTVQRWAAGEQHPPPADVLDRLIDHANERIAEIEAARDEIAEMVLGLRTYQKQKSANLRVG